jgi:acyl-CoA synthetase (AMP-forming)/AMP-acid ligase II
MSAALRKAGAMVVPVNFRLRGPEVAYILNDSGARFIAAGPDFLDELEKARAEVERERTWISFAGAKPGWIDYQRLIEDQPASELDFGEGGVGASMIYTSGTTGRPKGAFRPKGLPLELALQTITIFGLTPADVHLVAGPGYHSAVGYFSALTVLMGGTIDLMPKFDPERALQLIERDRCTTTFMAPTLLQRIVDLPEPVRTGYDLSSMRAIILGAAPCPISLKERAIAMFGEVLWEFYGATETGVNIVLRPEEQLSKPGSCGRATEASEIRLLDEAGNEVPDGTPGRLWVRHGGLAEYFNRPDATERSMRDGFFSVGDVAYRDADGYYYICDRLVDMIISGGVNIYPAEIEATVHGHPAVRDVAVIGVPDDHWGESVKAIIELQPGAELTADDLIEWCGQRIAGYKKPRSVEFVDELPRGTDGKLHKRQLRERYWAAAGRRL